MIRKKLFLFLLLFIGQAVVSHETYAAQAPIAQESKNPLVWIGKGLLATAKGIGSGALAVGGATRDIWNATMTEPRFWTLLIGGSIASYAWREYNFRNIIKPIGDKYKPEDGKLCTWLEKDEFATHVQLRKAVLFVVNALEKRPECNPVNNPLNDQQKAQALQITLFNERNEIERDMKALEEQFVTFFATTASVFESFGCKSWGIVRSYEDIIAQRAQNIGELQWEPPVFNAIDFDMKNACYGKWWHLFPCLTGNYSSAAKIWWRLKKLQLRLKVLARIIEPIAHGETGFINFNYQNVNFAGNHWSTRHDHQPA